MKPPGLLARRPLVAVTVALMGGIVSPTLGLELPSWGVAGAALLILIAIGLCWVLRRSCGWLSLVLFWLVGFGLYQSSWQPTLAPQHLCHLPQDTFINLIGTLYQPPKSQPERLRFALEVNSWLSPQGWRTTSGKLQVQGPVLPEPLTVGDRVALLVKLRPVVNLHNPGSFNRQRFLARKQIFTLATLKDGQHLVRLAATAPPPWLTRQVERVRARSRQFLQHQPPRIRALYKALLLGDQGEITPEIRQWFSRTGTSHLLAISGLHLGLVAAVAFGLFFWLLRRSAWLLLRVNAVKLATLAAIGPVWAYALIAGGSPATQRAEIMILVYLLLVLLERHRDLYNALTLAALVILIISPLMLFSLSFQLSFLSILGIAYLVPKWTPSLKDWWWGGVTPATIPRRLYFWVEEGLAVSAAATLATLPLVAASFNLVPTYGILVNLVAIPLFSFLALPLGLGALAVLPWFPNLAQLLLTLGGLPLELGLRIISGAASLPGAALKVPTPTPWQIGAYYLLLVCLFSSIRNVWKWAGVGLGVLYLAGSICYPAVSYWITPRLEVIGLDTPREMAAVVTFPAGARMVVSAGAPTARDYPEAGGRILSSYLHYRQIRRVDYLTALAITRQNAASLLAVAQNFGLGQFWYDGGRVFSPSFWELKNMLGDRRLPVLNLALHPPPAEIQEVALKVFQAPGWGGRQRSGPVVLQLGYKGQRLLFIPPGYREWQEQLLAFGPTLASEVVWVAGQIKQTQFWSALLRNLHPRLVVVTGGRAEGQKVELQASANMEWRYTSRGAVTVALTGSGLAVSQ